MDAISIQAYSKHDCTIGKLNVRMRVFKALFMCSTFQNKVLRSILNAPWYVSNRILHADLLIPTVREEVTKHTVAHKDKLRLHPNQLIPTLLEGQRPKRLKRYDPLDLTHRFS
jgi:hypothetical protein